MNTNFALDRRTALAFSTTAMLLSTVPAGTASAQPAGGTLPAPMLRFVCAVSAIVEPGIELGIVDGAEKRVVPITSGTVTGPHLRGVVHPGGADWQEIRSTGVADLWARYLIEASDGSLITVTNSGLRRGPADVLARVAAGENVDPTEYYFRSTPRFEVASSSEHAWLMESIFVCTGKRTQLGVLLDIYEVS